MSDISADGDTPVNGGTSANGMPEQDSASGDDDTQAHGLSQAPDEIDALMQDLARQHHLGIRRRYFMAAGAGAVLAFVLFLMVMQGGRDGLFGRDLLGDFYDAQARAIRSGHLDVPADVPGFEGFLVDGRTYIYQGLTPVIARIPILAATSLDGRLSGVSMLTAYAVILTYLVVAGWRARLSLRPRADIAGWEQTFTALGVFGVGTGLITFLASRAWVYHEAAIWGVATALASLVHLSIWLDSRWPQGRSVLAVVECAERPEEAGPVGAGARIGRREASRSTGASRSIGVSRWPYLHLACATIFAGLAFNSRVSIGIGPFAALGLACVVLIVDGLRGRHDSVLPSLRSGIAPIAMVIIGSLFFVGAYAAVNYARFGSLFGVPLDKQRLVETDPLRIPALEANGGSLFGLRYTPSVAVQLLRPDAFSFRGVFPYIGFPTHRPSVVGSALFAERDWSTSIPTSTPLGFTAGLIGIAIVVAPRRMCRALSDRTEPDIEDVPSTDSRPSTGAAVGTDGVATTEDSAPSALSRWRIPVLGAFLSGAPVLIFGYMAQRYMTDLYPFVVLSSVLGLQWLASRTLDRRRTSRQRWSAILTGCVVAALALFGAWLTSAVALQYQREIAPGLVSVDREGWLNLQIQLPGVLDVMSVDGPSELPETAPLGQVAIVDSCAGLYRWSGSTWNMLEASGGAADWRRGGPGEPTGLRVVIHSKDSYVEPVTILRARAGERPFEVTLQSISGGLSLSTNHGPSATRPLWRHDDGKGFTLELEVTEDPLIGELIIKEAGSKSELLTSYSAEPSHDWTTLTDPLAAVTANMHPLVTPVCSDILSS